MKENYKPNPAAPYAWVTLADVPQVIDGQIEWLLGAGVATEPEVALDGWRRLMGLPIPPGMVLLIRIDKEREEAKIIHGWLDRHGHSGESDPGDIDSDISALARSVIVGAVRHSLPDWPIPKLLLTGIDKNPAGMVGKIQLGKK